MHEWWSSWGRLAAIIAGSVVGVLILFLGFCLVTPPGHRLLASLIYPLSGESVKIAGLSGGLPNHVRAREVVLRDSAGPWLRADDVKLDWHILSLIGNHLKVDNLSAARIVVFRNKVPSKTASTSSTTIDVNKLQLARIELNPDVLGHRAVLTASGSMHYASRHDVAADLAVRRLDGAGRYDVHAAIVHDIARGSIRVEEGGEGLAGGAIGMPDLGAVSLQLTAGGRGSRNDISFRAAADLLDVNGSGTIDLAANQADIDFSAVAPEMHPNPQLSWSVLSVRGHMHGPFTRPDISADLKITGLNSGGNRIGTLMGSLRGSGGKAELHATAADLHLSNEKAPVFAGAPFNITADADLAAPSRPIVFTIDHPYLKVKGRSTTRAPIVTHVDVTLPALDRITGLTGVALNGNAAMAVDFRQGGTGGAINAKGRIAAQGGNLLGNLLGNAQLAMNVSIRDAQNLSLQASLKGKGANAQFGGAMDNGKQDFSGEISIPDLSRVVSTLAGNMVLHERLTGPQGNGVLAVNGTIDAATKGMARQSLTVMARANGLPDFKTASLRLSGRFDAAPVSVKADIAQAGGATRIILKDASWRSAKAQGSAVIANGKPKGSIALQVARLADLAPLVGSTLDGSIDARSDFQATSATIHAGGQNIAMGTTRINNFDLNGTIADPLGKPSLALTLAVPKFASSAVSGSANAKINGPLKAVAVNLTSNLTASNGQQFSMTADALADTAAKHVTVSRFATNWQDQTIHLARPATIDYSDGLKFAATFTDGKAAQLTVAGTVPAAANRQMNVRANGTADLGVMAATLASVGETIRGKLALNATVTGTTAKPVIVGNATLSGGDIQDYPHGMHLTNVEAVAQAQGDKINLTKFTAAAGPGTITGSGTVDLATHGMPVNVTFTGKNARPIESDLITAYLDTDLKLAGNLADHLTLTGKVTIRKGNINVPEKFPTEVATLNVRRPHQAPPPPPSSSASTALDLTITSPGQIFVRGRGLEAEFEGNLKITGTTSAPQVEGALDMRRGSFTLAGTNLVFQSGTISFNGQALRRRLDPSLDLTAETEANGITATLKITGTVSQPKIQLTSSPPLPQDEILSELLFQQSAKTLSAMQLASLASAAATLGGGGGGFDPVGSVRKSLGLDRLAVGSMPSANGGSGTTTVEAGKYITRNVYLAARQDVSGGTRALVQIDITKHLKAQAQVNTGPRAATTTSTPLQDNGDSIGLSWQYDY